MQENPLKSISQNQEFACPNFLEAKYNTFPTPTTMSIQVQPLQVQDQYQKASISTALELLNDTDFPLPTKLHN
jgi:hypothetical protein